MTEPRPSVALWPPLAGCYQVRLIRGGPWVGVRIWYGPPHDPVSGEELDRSHRWQALRDGKPVDVDHVWPGCASHPVDEPRYRYLVKVADWAAEHAPERPEASPRTAIDFNKIPAIRGRTTP